MKRNQIQNKEIIGFCAEKEQTNTLIGIIFILAIATAVGGLFLLSFNDIGQMVVDSIKEAFSSIVIS